MNADFFSTANLTRLFIRICVIVLALFLVTELVLWIFFRAPSNPTMTMRLKNTLPGLKESVTLTVDPDEQLRSINWTKGTKAPGTVRILCIGGFATLGQFQNTADTWWGQLAAKLEEKLPNVKIEIGANGSGGNLALPGAKWSSAFVQEWKPDIIITSLGAGDVLNQPLEYSYDANRFSNIASGKRERGGMKELLLKVSQLAKWSRVRNARSDAARVEYQIGSKDYYTENFAKMRTEFAKMAPIPNPFRLSDADPRNEYADALKQIIEQAKATGATLLLTGEPNLCHEGMSPEAAAQRCMFMPKSSGQGNMVVKADSAWVEREIRRFQEVAEKLASENQLTFVDLNGMVPQTPQHFLNETILTDEGAKTMADLLLPKVLPLVQKVSGN